MDESSGPLVAFFKTILKEMKKRMTVSEFGDLLKEIQQEVKRDNAGRGGTD